MHETSYIKKLAADLMSRLPELEWKIAALNPAVLRQSIPKKLFRSLDLSSECCIAELKADLRFLGQQKSSHSAFYLAGQIQLKVNVLVGACKVHHNVSQETGVQPFAMTQISTRQQWLCSLEHDIAVLTQQQQSLETTLEKKKTSNTELSLLLNIQAELGAVEKKLTLAQEALKKAVALY